MPLTVSATELGTSELSWMSHGGLEGLAPLDWPTLGTVTVVAPHPDDECLGAAGALFSLARRGLPVSIVAVTDGEACHPHSPTTLPRRMAEMRAAERLRALAHLGLADASVVRLGIPDGAVARCSNLVSLLEPLIRGTRLCLAPLSNDGHPDHDAVGRAALEVCARQAVPLISYPIWAWHWAKPGGGQLPLNRARSFALDREAQRAKAAAIEEYASQIRALSPAPGDECILPPAVLARFLRPFEVFFV